MDREVVSEDDAAYMPKPVLIQQDGSRFQTREPGPGFTRIGWQNPISLWSQHIQPRIRGFISPLPSTYVFSHSREAWHSIWCKPSSMSTWLLSMEEHTFYLFTIKCVATTSLEARSNLSVKDREKTLAMNPIAKRDLRDERFTFKSFRYPDSLLPYVVPCFNSCFLRLTCCLVLHCFTLFNLLCFRPHVDLSLSYLCRLTFALHFWWFS